MQLVQRPLCGVVLNVGADALQVGVVADDVFVIVALPDGGVRFAYWPTQSPNLFGHT